MLQLCTRAGCLLLKLLDPKGYFESKIAPSEKLQTLFFGAERGYYRTILVLSWLTSVIYPSFDQMEANTVSEKFTSLQLDVELKSLID
jgi:hypothetical protein